MAYTSLGFVFTSMVEETSAPIAKGVPGTSEAVDVDVAAGGRSGTTRERLSGSSMNLTTALLWRGGTSGFSIVTSRQYLTMWCESGVFSVSTTSLATSTTSSPPVSLN